MTDKTYDMFARQERQEPQEVALTVQTILPSGTAFGKIDATGDEVFIPSTVAGRANVEPNQARRAFVLPNRRYLDGTSPAKWFATFIPKLHDDAVRTEARGKPEAEAADDAVGLTEVYDADLDDDVAFDRDETLRALEKALRESTALSAKEIIEKIAGRTFASVTEIQSDPYANKVKNVIDHQLEKMHKAGLVARWVYYGKGGQARGGRVFFTRLSLARLSSLMR